MSFVTFDLQKLVTKSSLPMDIKCMLLVMLLHASGDKAEGYSSQAKIAEYMSCTDRHVRDLLVELSGLVAAGKSPIRVTRIRRGLKAGRGRGTDLYRIEPIVQTEQCSGSDTPKRNSIPVSPPPGSDDQPEQLARPTGTERPDQPEHSSDDHPSDQPRRDHPSSFAPAAPLPESVGSSAQVPGKGKPSKAKTQRREAKPQPPGTQELKVHYVAEFERVRRDTPEFGDKWPAQMIGLGKLVSKHGLDKAKTIITRAVADTMRDPTPLVIEKRSAMYQGTAPTNGRAAQPIQREMPTNIKIASCG